jgi:hypothetical protein
LASATSGAVLVYLTQQPEAVYRVNELLERRTGKLLTGLARWLRQQCGHLIPLL